MINQKDNRRIRIDYVVLYCFTCTVQIQRVLEPLWNEPVCTLVPHHALCLLQAQTFPLRHHGSRHWVRLLKAQKLQIEKIFLDTTYRYIRLPGFTMADMTVLPSTFSFLRTLKTDVCSQR